MKSLAGALLILLAPSCVAPVSEQEEERGIVWVGGYTKSNELFAAELHLNEGGTYRFVKRDRYSFPEEVSGEWMESPNMIHLAGWGIVEPYRFLNKMVIDGDKYLMPVGHSQFLYDQMGSAITFAFFDGSNDRRKELRELEFYEALIEAGITHEELVEDGFFDSEWPQEDVW